MVLVLQPVTLHRPDQARSPSLAPTPAPARPLLPRPNVGGAKDPRIAGTEGGSPGTREGTPDARVRVRGRGGIDAKPTGILANPPAHALRRALVGSTHPHPPGGGRRGAPTSSHRCTEEGGLRSRQRRRRERAVVHDWLADPESGEPSASRPGHLGRADAGPQRPGGPRGPAAIGLGDAGHPHHRIRRAGNTRRGATARRRDHRQAVRAERF